VGEINRAVRRHRGFSGFRGKCRNVADAEYDGNVYSPASLDASGELVTASLTAKLTDSGAFRGTGRGPTCPTWIWNPTLADF